MRPYLRIEKPCTESADKMADIPGGKYCSLCSKKVYDLTTLTHTEIADIIIQNNSEKFCGILINRKPEQHLENRLQFNKDIRPRNITFTKIAAGFALTAGIIQHHPAQTGHSSVTEVKTPQKKPDKGQQKDTNILPSISGKVVSDGTGKPISADVSLITVSQVYSTKTDENGFFTLEIPEELIKESNFLLEFNPDPFIFDRRLKVFSKDELSQNTTIKLQENGMLQSLGEISVGPPYAGEHSFVFLHGKRLDYKLYNKSYSLYSKHYDVHYIPKPFTKFFTESNKVEDIYIVFVRNSTSE